MISNDLIGYYVNHEEFVCANNVLREHSEMKEKNKNHEIAKKKEKFWDSDTYEEMMQKQ